MSYALVYSEFEQKLYSASSQQNMAKVMEYHSPNYTATYTYKTHFTSI